MMTSSFLRGILKTLSINNASTNTILSVSSFNVQRQRHIHLNRFLCQSKPFSKRKRIPVNVRKSIEKEGAVTLWPKAPLPPFFRFMQQVRVSVKAEYPHLKPKELSVMIAERWKSLDANEKKILSNAYRDDLLEYSKESANYDPDIGQLIQLKDAEISDKKQIRFYKKKAIELNKPKKPLSSFLRYLHKQTNRRPDESRIDFCKRIGLKWQSLTEATKKTYKTKPEELENYKKAMLAWETAIKQLSEREGEGSITMEFKDEGDKGVDDDEFFDKYE